MTDKISRFAVVVGAIGLMALTVYLIVGQSRLALASAPSGLPGTLATSSVAYLGPQLNVLLFATSTCSSRIVSTTASPIMLQFTGAFGTTTLNGQIGHLQGASTTVAYDSGLYGCGTFYGYGFSSTTVTISETR